MALPSALNVQVDRLAYGLLWTFTFSLPWERELLAGSVGGLGRLLGLVAISATLMSVADRGTLRLRRPPVVLVLMAVFVAWATVSVFWSVAPGISTSRAFTFVQLLAMVWMYGQLARTHRRQRALFQAFVLGCWVMIALVTATFAANAGDGLVRYTALGANQNYLAQIVVLGIPMAWYLTLTTKRALWQWIDLAYVPAAILVLGLAASRGALVMGVVALTILPLTAGRMPPIRRAVVFALLLTSSLAVLQFVPTANLERLSATTDRIAAGDLTNREDIWRAGLVAYASDTAARLVGAGVGSYPVAVAPVLGSATSSHNAYLSVLIELGLFGLVLFLAIISMAVLPTVTLASPERWLYGVLWASLLVAMMTSNWEYERVTWFVLAMLMTARGFVLVPEHTPADHRGPRGAS